MSEEFRRLMHWTFRLDQPNPLKPGLALVVVVAALNAACMGQGCYDRFELADLDPFLRTTEAAAERTSLVLIDDDDYASFFGGKSPLEPARVIDLIAAVCRFNPALIGVDLLTSDWTADDRRRALSDLKGCPIIWVRDATVESGEESGASAPHGFVLGGVVGSDGPPETDERVCAALPILETDDDGVVRAYRTHALARVKGNPEERPYASLVWAMASPNPQAPRCGFEGGTREPSALGNPKKIRFFEATSVRRLPASRVLAAAQDPNGALFAAMQRQVLKPENRVIIGGAYRHARDRYATPIGSLHGAELLAHAIETEDDHEIRQVSWGYSLLVDSVMGALLFVALNRLKLRLLWDTLLSTLAAVAATLVVCYYMFNYFGYFLGVAGSFAGIVLGALAAALWEPFKHELEELVRRAREIYRRTPDEPQGTA